MELLSISDIAKIYNVSRHSVWNWHRRIDTFPAPTQYIGNGRSPLFDKKSIDQFMFKNGIQVESDYRKNRKYTRNYVIKNKRE